ncbi:xylulokinase [Bacteroidota bacterium]
MALLIGYDVGSSSVKVSLLDAEKEAVLGSAVFPKKEMEMISEKPGWAEQHPEMWWENLKMATAELKDTIRFNKEDVQAIGISYQMHGLVLVDREQQVLRPSIIWCDSRAVKIGNKAIEDIGKDMCLEHLLNSPGNFTASKLKWVKDNEPDIYDRAFKAMLPGDYIAMKLTGDINTTISGLSEGILWDFKNADIAHLVLDQYEIGSELIPDLTPTFSVQGELSKQAADELGLHPGTKIAYRAGDQPNNAFSLNVLNSGELATTAGTSGVIYGIIEEANYDPKSRVNTFVHVNYDRNNPKYGVLLCVNGTGILNSWLKHNTGDLDYPAMNDEAIQVPIGADGLMILPFGNGAERILENKDINSRIVGLNYNRHDRKHVLRAAQEGIVFALCYGFDVMKEMGIKMKVVRAGEANMFLSPVFRETFANTTGASIELYNTDGSQGAARGAGIGSGIYSDFNEAFTGLNAVMTVDPEKVLSERYEDAYQKWKELLFRVLNY